MSAEPSSSVLRKAFETIAHAKPDGSVMPVDGLDIKAVPSSRGETRVWIVREVNASVIWYVKRFRNPADYRRFVEGLCLIRQDESSKTCLCPVKCAEKDDFNQILATYPLQGTSVNSLFIRATRLDKLFSWPHSDLAGLARRIIRGLRAFWGQGYEMNTNLYDYTSSGSAARLIRKCERLRDILPDSWERLQLAVAHHARRLRSNNDHDDSLVLGDLALENMLIRDEGLCIFDLDDIGIGDWRRDIACLMQRLSDAEVNIYYSRNRVRYFKRLLMDEVGLAEDNSIIAIYRIEFYLDALWSARHYQNDLAIPTPRLSERKIVQFMERYLQRLSS